MPLKKITPGERIVKFPAEAYNGLIDLLGRAPPPGGGDGSDGYGDRSKWDLIITGYTEVTADQKWTYTVKILYDDVTSDAWGGGTPSAQTYEARNTWEDDDRVGDATGYENDNDGIYPIKVGAVVEGRLITTSDATFFRFRERNEPICPPP